ncbi:hypothetical protein A2U01_0116778, partial [Trifolium medium]|nr:hypothetical protein [Trifolium medium]
SKKQRRSVEGGGHSADRRRSGVVSAAQWFLR